MSLAARLLLFLAFAVSPAFSQVTRHVPSVYATIQAGLDAALPGDTVLVDFGFYNESNLDFRGKSVHLRSVSGALATIIDAQLSGPCLVFDQGEGPGAIIEGFSLINGVGGPGQAGGITVELNCAPQIRDCVIQNNTGTVGNSRGAGGISIFSIFSSVVIDGCTIVGNTCNGGAGSTNVAGAGGMLIRGGSHQIRNCRIENNTSLSFDFGSVGGVLFTGGSTATMDSCLVVLNRGGDHTQYAGGGGIASNGAAPRIVNTVVARNVGGDSSSAITSAAGGITIAGSTSNGDAYLTNCSVVSNQAGSGRVQARTGGLVVLGSSTTLVTNTLLWGNLDSASNPSQASSTGTLTMSYCAVQGGYSGTGIVVGDPLLSEDPDGFWRLGAGSSCIDVGDPAAPFGTAADYEGDPRPFGPGVDIGADEYTGSQISYPGTGDDFRLASGVNAAPTSGPGEDIVTGTAYDLLHLEMDSPLGGFDFSPLILVASLFPTGSPPVPPLPGIAVDPIGVLFLVDGVNCAGFGCAAILPGGTGVDLFIPPGLAGTSVMLQGLVIASPGFTPLNGSYATTNGHELRIL